MTPLLAAIPAWSAAVGIVLFLAICVCLILIVLIQRPQGGGLGGAFGGGAAGSGQSAFGARTGDVLTWTTIGLFVVFLTIAALLNFVVLPPTAEIAPSISPASATPVPEVIDLDDLVDSSAAPTTPIGPNTQPVSAPDPDETSVPDSAPASTTPPTENLVPDQSAPGGGAS